MKNLIAVIPARKIDSLLADKNILPIGNTNLLTNKIKQLKSVSQIDEIIVSSDCEEYLEIAKSNDVSIDYRPKYLSNIDSNFGELIYYLASKIECRHILWAPTITPLICREDYSDAILKYFSGLNDGFDSLITVNRLRRNLLDDNGPLNFSFYNTHYAEFPNIYEYVNGITIAKRSDMLSWKYNWGKNPLKIELGPIKSIDICNEIDYQIAQLLFNYRYE